MGWPQLVFQNCSFLIGKPTEVLGAQMTRSPAGLSAVHRVVHPDLDDSAGQSMTSWKKKNNLDWGEGVKSTERERDIYIYIMYRDQIYFSSSLDPWILAETLPSFR